MQYELQVFETEEKEAFRTINRDGEPWFVLADVCKALDIGNPSQAASRLDTDEKSTLTTNEGRSGPQAMTVINESGLFSLILTSRKEGAKRFKKWITSEVLPSIRKTGGYGRTKTPRFIERFNANWDRVSPGHFSVISELMIRLNGRLEMLGHIMADLAKDGKTENRPDGSVGRLFSNWLKDNHPRVADNYSYYLHWTPKKEFDARQYPNSMLPLYIEFVETVWIPQHSRRYFSTRDPEVIPHLPKLVASVAARPPSTPRIAQKGR